MSNCNSENKIINKAPDIPIEQATAESVSNDVFNREFGKLKEDIKKQEQISWGIVIGVVIAFIIAIGVIIFENRQNVDSFLDLQDKYFQEIKELRESNFQDRILFQKEINELKNSVQENNNYLNKIKK